LEDGRRLLDGSVHPIKLYTFVVAYVATMYELLKSVDPDIAGTYHTAFTKGFLQNLFTVGKNTRLFFSYQDADAQYFIDIRPTCIYFSQLMPIPPFLDNMNTYKTGSKLIETTLIQKHVEGNILDPREFTFHDLGHSYVMSRQDTWLFETINRGTVELVREWVRNKKWYMREYRALKSAEPELAPPIMTFLFDIVHDRGYQFYLPILRQQIRAQKNLENFKTKLLRGNFEGVAGSEILPYVEQARDWLLKVTDKFLIKDNIDKIRQYKNRGYIIKKYLDVESGSGRPIGVVILKDGKILVNFNSDGVLKTASLYEIELLGLPVTGVLSQAKVEAINNWLGMMKAGYIDNLHLDREGNIINLPGELPVDDPTRTSQELKGIEVYKLERLFEIIKLGKTVKFSLTSLPDVHESDTISIHDGYAVIDTGISFKLSEVSIEPKPHQSLKYVNLDAHLRFVDEDVLRRSYVRYPNSLNPTALPYVPLEDGYELGIVDTKNNIQIAKAVSSLLSRSIDDARDVCHNGYLPERIVRRAQLEYVSPYAVSNLWGRSGNRFVLSRNIGYGKREIIATALISSSKDNLFFFTSKYNNIKHSTMAHDIDWEMKVNGGHKWFDRFSMPEVAKYKLVGYNQLANFSVEKVGCRDLGLSRLLLQEIRNHYALRYICKQNGIPSEQDEYVWVDKQVVKHCQPMVCGKGLFQIADPSWLPIMRRLGFELRMGAETFYLDQDYDPLPQIIRNRKTISIEEYNTIYGITGIYEDHGVDYWKERTTDNSIHLLERVPEVVSLAKSGKAKLQYYQLVYPFGKE
jgi:hypothetical protein